MRCRLIFLADTATLIRCLTLRQPMNSPIDCRGTKVPMPCCAFKRFKTYNDTPIDDRNGMGASNDLQKNFSCSQFGPGFIWSGKSSWHLGASNYPGSSEINTGGDNSIRQDQDWNGWSWTYLSRSNCSFWHGSTQPGYSQSGVGPVFRLSLR